MRKKYPSAVDLWLAAILVAVPVALIVAGVATLPAASRTGIFLIVQGCFVGGLMAALTIPCVYTITDKNLHIRCGLMNSQIALRDISHVERSSAIWSAPALSLKRVHILHRGGRALISPRQRDEFIADLQLAAARARQAAPA